MRKVKSAKMLGKAVRKSPGKVLVSQEQLSPISVNISTASKNVQRGVQHMAGGFFLDDEEAAYAVIPFLPNIYRGFLTTR